MYTAGCCNFIELATAHVDVVTAFRNGDLDRCVYKEQPTGFIAEQGSDYVCKLRKSIYGLKQASPCWYKMISDLLTTQHEFSQNPAVKCLYKKYNSGAGTIVALYVDD